MYTHLCERSPNCHRSHHLMVKVFWLYIFYFFLIAPNSMQNQVLSWCGRIHACIWSSFQWIKSLNKIKWDYLSIDFKGDIQARRIPVTMRTSTLLTHSPPHRAYLQNSILQYLIFLFDNTNWIWFESWVLSENSK